MRKTSVVELSLPKIGLGTWQMPEEKVRAAVPKAVEIGYRFFDTAQMYHNEGAVGDALKEVFHRGVLGREDVILATKINVFNYKPSKLKKSAEESLKKLKTEYVDILYVHWPAFAFGYRHKETLGALAELVEEGKVRYIGVSNFTVELMEEAEAVCPKPIIFNQVEHHVLLKQPEMREYLAKNHKALVAYSPLARGRLADIPELKSVAQKYDVSVERVALAWLIHHGAIPIPKASSEVHLRENYSATEMELEDSDAALIDGIQKERRLFKPPFLSPKGW